MEIIQKIPKKMVSTWNSDVKAIIDTWTTYNVTLDEFKKAILIKGVNFSKKHNGIAWIVDSSNAVGVFSQEIQEFIRSIVFPTFVKNNIKFFFTIKPKIYGLTSLTVGSYAAKAGSAGLKLIDVHSVDDAIMWIKKHAND
ncbi:hypothetical protein HOD20_07230 [archaeon]|jgi:hypothetical protein|nr:hypothetical protein [archaeon]MBT4647967.1 hypothetical protein [archaeon]MBT7391349.1 hypothetical protein [archaeon]